MLHDFPITLIKKEVIAEKTVEMTFSISDPTFTFKAGQYVSVGIPALSNESVPDRYHDFSIVSSPLHPEKISIVFRVSESIYKKALLDIPVGGEVTIDGPKGVLTLPENTDIGLVFVAGGVGISPLLSMMRHVTETSSPQSITLLYCNEREEAAVYREELAVLVKQNPHIVYQEWWGRPQKELFARHILQHPDTSWYIVGMPAMVENVEKMLLEAGVSETKIRIEEFTGY